MEQGRDNLLCVLYSASPCPPEKGGLLLLARVCLENKLKTVASRIHLERLPNPLPSGKTGEKGTGEVVREGGREEGSREGEGVGWVREVKQGEEVEPTIAYKSA